MPLSVFLVWAKCCHHHSGFSFYWISFILADNEDRHKISVRFDLVLSYIPLTVRKFGHRLNMGKWCHHDSDFSFFQIGFNLA